MTRIVSVHEEYPSMTSQADTAENSLEKIRSLPAERIAEVEDFVDFLRERSQGRA
jgi:secreted trypsin-like serine protease